jgi:guanyl-specific ribonuclease Sa
VRLLELAGALILIAAAPEILATCLPAMVACAYAAAEDTVAFYGGGSAIGSGTAAGMAAKGSGVAAKGSIGLRIKEGPIPEKVLSVLERVDAKGAPFPGYKGGKDFLNDGSQGASILPRKDGVAYREWDVNIKIKGVDRGGERLVTGSDNSVWYTDDHYRSFYIVRGAAR